jgi:hypothetical protein
VKNGGGSDLIKEVREEEVIVNAEINEDVLQQLLKFLKETEKYKELTLVNKLVDVKGRKLSALNDKADSNVPIYPDPQVHGSMTQTIVEHEIYEELGVSQEKRRRALRQKDFEILHEDEMNTKV